MSIGKLKKTNQSLKHQIDMKKLYSFLVVIFLVCQLSEAQENVLANYNPSFELWNNGAPISWIQVLDETVGTPTVSVSEEVSDVYDGSKALKVSVIDGGDKPWAISVSSDVRIPVADIAGKELSLYAKVSSANGQKLQIIIQAYDENGDIIPSSESNARKLITPTMTAEYALYKTVYHAVPNPLVKHVGIQLNLGSNGTNWNNNNTTFYVDKVVFDGANQVPTNIFSSKIEPLKIYVSDDKSFLTVDGEEQGIAEIYNLSGSMVKQVNVGSREVISIADLRTGMYIIKINDKTNKFVK